MVSKGSRLNRMAEMVVCLSSSQMNVDGTDSIGLVWFPCRDLKSFSRIMNELYLISFEHDSRLTQASREIVDYETHLKIGFLRRDLKIYS